MKKYVRIQDNIVAEVIELDANINLTDLYIEEFTQNCILVDPDIRVESNWSYENNQFRPPKPSQFHSWSDAGQSWVFNKKLCPPDSFSIWSDLHHDWVKIIYKPGEFFALFTDEERLKWKKEIQNGNTELSLFEDKFKLADSINICDKEVKDILDKLTLEKYGTILTTDRVRDIIKV